MEHQTADWITAAALEIASSGDKTYFPAWPSVITVHLAPWRLQIPDMLWCCFGSENNKENKKDDGFSYYRHMCLLKLSLTLSDLQEFLYDTEKISSLIGYVRGKMPVSSHRRESSNIAFSAFCTVAAATGCETGCFYFRQCCNSTLKQYIISSFALDKLNWGALKKYQLKVKSFFLLMCN